MLVGLQISFLDQELFNWREGEIHLKAVIGH